MENLVWAIGRGESLEKASLAAISDASRQVTVSVTGQTVVFERVTATNVASRTTASTTVDYEYITSLVSQRIRRIDQTVDHQNQTWVLAYLQLQNEAPESFDVEQLRRQISAKRRRKSASAVATSILVPGGGHLLDGQKNRSIPYLATAGAAALMAGGSAVAAQQAYANYQNAPTNAEEEFHFKSAQSRSALAIGGIGLYLATGLLAAVDLLSVGH